MVGACTSDCEQSLYRFYVQRLGQLWVGSGA